MRPPPNLARVDQLCPKDLFLDGCRIKKEAAADGSRRLRS
jgi:hypothetical protein